MFVNIENGDQRYSQTGSECRVRNINGHAMLLDSTETILTNALDQFTQHFYKRSIYSRLGLIQTRRNKENQFVLSEVRIKQKLN